MHVRRGIRRHTAARPQNPAVHGRKTAFNNRVCAHGSARRPVCFLTRRESSCSEEDIKMQ